MFIYFRGSFILILVLEIFQSCYTLSQQLPTGLQSKSPFRSEELVSVKTFLKAVKFVKVQNRIIPAVLKKLFNFLFVPNVKRVNIILTMYYWKKSLISMFFYEDTAMIFNETILNSSIHKYYH